MGVLKKWFGEVSFENLPAKIQKEVGIIEDLLENSIEIEGARTEKIRRVLQNNIRTGNICLKLERTLMEFLEPYISGKKRLRGSKLSLRDILFLYEILSELREEDVWQELGNIWQEELNILEDARGHGREIKRLVLRQQDILRTLKELCAMEYNETHIHIGQSADPDVHWKFLKKYWKMSVDGKLNHGLDIIVRYRKMYKEGKILKEDYFGLRNIMRNFFTGKWSEVKAFLEFVKLISFNRENVGFVYFQKKANVLGVIDEVSDNISFSRKKVLSEGYFLEKIESVAKHCLDHRVRKVELRGCGANLEMNKKMIDVAMKVERKFSRRIKIRFVTFSGDDLEDLIKAYRSLPVKYRKYIVAFDLIKLIDVEKMVAFAEDSPLPLCVHAGEFYGENDYGFERLNSVERIEKSLRQVEICTNSKMIHRIGHANILAEDILDYVKSEGDVSICKYFSKIVELRLLQKRIISKIISRGIFIETNPTSNVRILGIRYLNHPISLFDRKGVLYSISTDDRIIFNTNLKKEYLRIYDSMKWDIERLREVNRVSASASLV